MKQHEQQHKPVISIFIEPAAGGEDNKGDFSVAEHRQLIGLLEQPIPALAESDLPIGGVLDPLDLDLPSPVLPQRIR